MTSRGRSNGSVAGQRVSVLDPDRLRIFNALVTPFAEHGFNSTSTEHLLDATGLDRESFAALFVDKEDCFQQVFDLIVEQACQEIIDSVEARDRWPRQLATGLRTLFELIDASPAAARLTLVEAPRATPTTTARYFAAINLSAPFMERGIAFSPFDPPPIVASALPAGVAYMLGRNLSESSGPVSGLYPETLELLLRPYLDASAIEDLRSSQPMPGSGRAW